MLDDILTWQCNGSRTTIEDNHLAIDCGCSYEGGRLAAVCLDTGEEFYVERGQ